MKAMPRKFRTFLIGVALFGIGDFSALMLVSLMYGVGIDATWLGSICGHDIDEVYRSHLRYAQITLYFLAYRNIVQAISAFPAGWLGDRFGHRNVLSIGYMTGVVLMVGLTYSASFHTNWPVWVWIGAFSLSGVYMAIQETVEPALVPELVPDKQLQGTAFGVLAAVNGYGDVVASFTVGLTVYYFGWPIALGYAAVMMTLGAVWTASLSFRPKSVVP